ncbi:hypothetical protein [Phenylobacterium sp.]|jgi:hypothetical protein|uniref:hypothetical protein n=1 Tax=Phenylobacterium sp. TaxID=1871053 RepID=UPI002E2EF75E|nr:hypothetical protein [Phenylobacterium sp.]HEX3363964.1 hypothetical protein [Phenylobacterium sp.]
MEKFAAGNLMPVIASMMQLSQVASTDRANRELPADAKARADGILFQASYICTQAGLAESLAMIVRLNEQFQTAVTCAELQHTFHQLMRLIESEMDKKLFLVVQPDTAEYFDQEALFGPEVYEAFVTPREDIREAGSCYALGRYTACVHHCMRALEPALEVMASDLNVPFGVDHWNALIEQIESRIREAGKALPRASRRMIAYNSSPKRRRNSSTSRTAGATT